MSQRIKGQEIEVLLVVGGVVQDTITDVRSFEIAGMLELLTEGYLGEKTDRRDEIYRGVRGSIEFHFENQTVLLLLRSIIDRARRRDPTVRINIKATLNFPNGQKPRIVIENVFFGEIPISFGGRSEYGTVRLDYEAADFTVIASA